MGDINTGSNTFKVYTTSERAIAAANNTRINITTDGSGSFGPTPPCNAQCQAVYKPTDFRIFGYGTTSNPSQMCVNGNRVIEAFILAPKYAIGRTGTARFTGSVWVDGFMNATSCGVGNTNLVVTQNGTWSDFGLTPSNLPPQISPPQTWTKLEAR